MAGPYKALKGPYKALLKGPRGSENSTPGPQGGPARADRIFLRSLKGQGIALLAFCSLKGLPGPRSYPEFGGPFSLEGLLGPRGYPGFGGGPLAL